MSLYRVYRGAAHTIRNLKSSGTKRIPAVYHNGSSYDYHFIIKELAEYFFQNIICLGDNVEKHIIFTVQIEK